MADPSINLFGNNDGLDPLGPYRRHEETIQDTPIGKIATTEIHIEQFGQDGTRHVFAQTRYLCQDCGKRYVIMGQTGSIVDNQVLCTWCRIWKWLKWLLKPFWSLLVDTKTK